MGNNYSIKNFEPSTMARAMGKDIGVSRKQSIEICNCIRNKRIELAKRILSEAIEKKMAIPFRRYNTDLGHKPKMGPGSYPFKASKEILRLIEGAEANAQFKGLNTANLYISHIKVNQSPKALHYGRKSRRRMKRASIEIVLEEKKQGREKKQESKK